MKKSREEVDDHVRMQEFQRFLSQINRGEFLSELGETLREVNDVLSTHASQNGKAKGSITITLAISHDGRGLVEVSPDLKKKLPPTIRGKAVFFATEGGALANKDPRQVELPLREVKAPDVARDVPADERPAKSV